MSRGAEEGSAPAEGPAPAAGRSGLAAALGPDFSVSQALGGPRGVVEVALPSVVFVVVISVVQDLRAAIWAALGTSALFVLVRLVGRSSPGQAVSGLLGVALCALIASRTGEARDFFVWGLLVNVVYAAVYALSTVRTPAFSLRLGRGRRVRVPRGPWPVLGLALGLLTDERLAWKDDPRRLRVYVQATWIWVALFVLRLLVQGPLYLADEVAALGTARVVMGFPLFGVAAYLTWLLVRRVPLATRPAEAPARGPAEG
ncbi:DUF3159 domain-containing protein [Pseudokineococcus marinus]|uniref:DUF3159 domain-containing protein n=1 Tax=Pseudokineococcus marinus TaxID=351215 RepID=A0A849BQ38_9ACTN|nr:DUF3159 domain-containing protein [Pseudokineococcus marinus]NNH23595.1 DUF3159 domain-containing protein [Pseudokineococcus marinus]